MKKVLTIAGSDCSGGAGIQADLKTIAAHGVYGMSVIVSIVAENTSRVLRVEDVSPVMIEQQMDAIFEDIEVDAVKVGMLSQPESMKAVVRKLRQYYPAHVVIDSVMAAKDGSPLMKPEAVNLFIREVIPLAELLTPNIPEAEIICGMKIASAKDMEAAAIRIHSIGAENVLVKGGHARGNPIDILYDGRQFYYFKAERIPTKNTHGTGCTYSSAIASNLALGFELPEAVKKAKEYMNMVIGHSLEIGKGCGPTNHFYELYQKGLHSNNNTAKS